MESFPAFTATQNVQSAIDVLLHAHLHISKTDMDLLINMNVRYNIGNLFKLIDFLSLLFMSFVLIALLLFHPKYSPSTFDTT